MGEHLYRRGKTWWGWTFDASGKQERFSTGCTDKVAARIVLAHHERDAADPDTASKRAATLGQAFDLMMRDRRSLVLAGKRSESTLSFYDSHIRPWLIFAGRQIRRIPSNKNTADYSKTERDDLANLGANLALMDAGSNRFVDAFTIHRREQGQTERCIGHDRQTLKSALKMAKRDRIWSGDIEVIFGRFDTGYVPEQHHVSQADAWKLLAEIGEPSTDPHRRVLPHRRAYVSFMLATGAETGAILRARREDITETLVRVRGTKTRDRDRFVPIVTEWQRELLAYVEAHADGKDGMLFTPWASALRALKQAAKRAGIRHMNRHGLRHCYSAWMKAEGVPHSELYLAMGHASTLMLERVYGKPDGEELAKAMAASIAVRRASLTVIDGGKAPRKRAAKRTG